MRNMPFMVKFFREFPEIIAINMNYLNAHDAYRARKVKWRDGNKVVLFDSGKYTAVIMPLDTHGFENVCRVPETEPCPNYKEKL
jgi:hypothetical protein